MRHIGCEHSDKVLSAVHANPGGHNDNLPEFVKQSWLRCHNSYHIDPSSSRKPTVLTHRELKNHQEPLESFLRIAKTGLRQLHWQIAAADYVVMLANDEGVTIDYEGISAYETDLRKSGLYLGAIWSESHEGTNGIGTCISTRMPLTVHRNEHYRSRDIGLSCTVAPILNPYGELLAVLDVSSLAPADDRRSQVLALQLVSTTAMLIENAHFRKEMRERWIVRICKVRDVVSVQSEGLIALDDSGKVVAANNRAVDMGLTHASDILIGKNFAKIFALPLTNLIAQTGQAPDVPMASYTIDTEELYYLSLTPPVPTVRSTARHIERSKEPTRPRTGGHLSLNDLAGRDPTMQENVRQAQRLVDKDVSIFIGGETGTGKEAFAQALHTASNRAHGPFVGINCAAIPDTLIESELFGYADGAFTGAKKAGMRGKILQANGGTLFLDEIGDMPLQSQTRLLRVLAEREVVPLGGDQSIPVNIHVICASHHDIERLVTQGQFRNDLYFRLTNVRIKLPSFRDRQDKIDLVLGALALEQEASGVKAQLGQAALDTILAYDWPGNIRQLRGALKVALALNESGIIDVIDLPSEIRAPSPTFAASRSNAVFTSTARPDPDPAQDEVACLVSSLRRNRWCVKSSANELGVSRATLHRKIKKFGIVPPNQRDMF